MPSRGIANPAFARIAIIRTRGRTFRVGVCTDVHGAGLPVVPQIEFLRWLRSKSPLSLIGVYCLEGGRQDEHRQGYRAVL